MEADEPSVPIIDVGGNFTQGNISGQSATGSNISQIQYTNCTFVYPDGSTKQGYSWIYTQGARPIIDPKRVFGRETELEKIENYLEDNSALVIMGLRGTGKSTLASMFVDRMGESGKFAGIYWRKVDETTDISEIIGSFFTVIGKPVKDLERYKILDQINLLFNELNEASYLLVLDNFEVILDPQTNKPLESKVGFSELIESAKESCIRSKILFTSWDSLASERGIRPFSYQIRGLDTSAGILLLRREGLLNESEAELKEAIELSGGHPLALILLAQLVTGRAGKLSSLLNDDSLWIGEEGEVAENILNKVYNERLSKEERELLQYVSIFRQPAPAKAITKIANNPSWTESKVEKIAWKLCHKSLLQKNDENYWEESLISKYATVLLSEKSERHKLAMEYYRPLLISEKPAKKEDIQSLIEAHYHACMAEEYDQALHIIFDNNLNEYLSLWSNYTVFIDLYSKMLPEDHFGKEILLKDKGNHGVILGSMGIAYKDLGEPKKAIEYYEQALKIAQEIGNRQNEGVWLGNLGNAYSYLGVSKKAIEYYEQALKIAQEIGDRRNEGVWFGTMGNAYIYLGETKKAIEYHEQALKIAQEIGDRRNEGVWLGNLGIAYMDLGKPKKAIEYYEQALKICKEMGGRRDEGTWLRNLGIAYKNLSEPRKAIEYYEQALKIAQKIGDKRGEGNALGDLGIAYKDLGEPRKAIEYYEQALSIGKEIEDSRIIIFCERNLETLKDSKK
ncbi:tetratricopeptide repeat protein [Methanosarcina barkeri]|uniref:NB-ARC domain-containing protein n=1 Tax=Methanosarcina barkeri 227 TaxID=1434106 RepID=A0A0E3QZA8_METBA|nr:tetratricopeptide repeat protein [Methanosarcina barkeri]AKB57145.1 hypothetical protein MSBR2_0629 [Methanosarcina barkeri 227]